MTVQSNPKNCWNFLTLKFLSLTITGKKNVSININIKPDTTVDKATTP